MRTRSAALHLTRAGVGTASVAGFVGVVAALGPLAPSDTETASATDEASLVGKQLVVPAAVDPAPTTTEVVPPSVLAFRADEPFDAGSLRIERQDPVAQSSTLPADSTTTTSTTAAPVRTTAPPRTVAPTTTRAVAPTTTASVGSTAAPTTVAPTTAAPTTAAPTTAAPTTAAPTTVAPTTTVATTTSTPSTTLPPLTNPSA